jgi:hypothetical protein
VPQANEFRILDAYAGMTVLSNVLTVGKQSLWWGPDKGGAMIMSDNSVPFYMLRINRAIPFTFPWILKHLGPFRYDAFFGKLADHNFPPEPYMNGGFRRSGRVSTDLWNVLDKSHQHDKQYWPRC